MSDGFQVFIEGDEKIVVKFDAYTNKLRGELKTAMQRIVNTLVAYCKEMKLSGQVLHRRTGTLSRSIKGTVLDADNGITGQVTSRADGNRPLSYAAFWELGFRGTENVRAHIRKNASGGYSNVRAFVRSVNQAPRPFLKPTRDENVGYVAGEIKAAISKANA